MDRIYKSAPVAQAAPRSEPVSTPMVAQAPVPETKPKSVSVDEKAKSAAKQVPAASDKLPASAPLGNSAVREYIVKAGDTLSRLALEFYGSAHQWGRIYEANKNVVKNPDYIYIGMELVIPIDKRS